MSKISQISNNEVGSSVRTKLNTALESVDTDSTITGTGETGTPLSIADSLSNKENSINKNTGFNKNFGSNSGDVCEGNDSRLSDARTAITHSHPQTEVAGLSTALASKVDASQVLTNVPVNALFTDTDTVYDSSATLVDSDTVSPVTGSNKIITQADVTGGGDMSKATYDSGNTGVVDNSELVNGLAVETAVPSGAIFTDTVYDSNSTLVDSDTVSPVTESNKILTESDASGGGDMLKATYDSNSNGIVDNAALVNGLAVETAVPANALFTDNDTVYDDSSVVAAIALNTAKTSNIAHPLVEAVVPSNAVFTDTVYDDSSLSAAVGANTVKVSNVSHPVVESAVPLGAVFTDTDTIYDDTAISAVVALNTAKVSNISHPLVQAAVPANAIFTDTQLTKNQIDALGVSAGSLGGISAANILTNDASGIQYSNCFAGISFKGTGNDHNPTTTAEQILGFDAELGSTGVTAPTGSSKLTINSDGVYEIQCTALATTNDAETYEVYLAKNAIEVSSFFVDIVRGTGTLRAKGNDFIEGLTVSDELTLYVKSGNAGGALFTPTYLQLKAVKVGTVSVTATDIADSQTLHINNIGTVVET